MEQTQDNIVSALEYFRKEHIGGVKERKKLFGKKTAKFCQAQERFLSMSTKKSDLIIQEVIAFTNLFPFPEISLISQLLVTQKKKFMFSLV